MDKNCLLVDGTHYQASAASKKSDAIHKTICGIKKVRCNPQNNIFTDWVSKEQYKAYEEEAISQLKQEGQL